MQEISILVAARNDAATIAATLEAVDRVVTHNSLSVETLVVDDGSEDGTVDAALGCVARFPALHLRVLRRKKLMPGFGSIVRYGMAYANGRYCVLVSANGVDPVELLPQFVARLRAGAQVAQCNRFERPEDAVGVPAAFRTYQRVYRFAIRAALGVALSDSTYGFRAFDRLFVQAIGMSANRFDVCPEMTFKTLLCGGRIDYLPGKPREPFAGGSSKFALPSEFWGYAYVLARAALHRARIWRWF